eukprot:GFKZ01000098.1.p1 GENE.GFKZ01000098.1~~GFKZ01000098.1.p1  ORF type:complete len:109 (+),score=4.14 GFKZ01000098.1:378-704(+)
MRMRIAMPKDTSNYPICGREKNAKQFRLPRNRRSLDAVELTSSCSLAYGRRRARLRRRQEGQRPVRDQRSKITPLRNLITTPPSLNPLALRLVTVFSHLLRKHLLAPL